MRIAGFSLQFPVLAARLLDTKRFKQFIETNRIYIAPDENDATRIIARGSTVIVMYNYETQSKIVIPDAMRADLEALMVQ